MNKQTEIEAEEALNLYIETKDKAHARRAKALLNETPDTTGDVFEGTLHEGKPVPVWKREMNRRNAAREAKPDKGLSGLPVDPEVAGVDQLDLFRRQT